MDLTKILKDLRASTSYSTTLPLLSKAKLALLNLNALTPQPSTDAKTLLIAREVFEIGALASIRAEKPDEFTRFVHQLTPFYELPAERLPGDKSERNKITGLYLLLLLTLGNYAGFHTELEGLELRGVQGAGMVEDDKYLGYPIRLERWLMEGSYDLVWKAMASRTVPCEEYGVFSNILTSQIRSEIASCSEKAYPSLPISSTKNLLFLESEGAVIQFAEYRQWVVRDGRIYFPNQNVRATLDEGGVEKEASQVAIENTLGYARELETIV